MHVTTTDDPPPRKSPTSLRLPDQVTDWYAERAAELGLSPHALMVRVLLQQMTPRKASAA